jgi:hypothetical protein
MTDNDKAIASMEDGIASVLRTTADATALPRVPRTEPSLPDQIAQLERIDRQIAEKIRRERLNIKNEYDRLWVETNNSFAARISEEVSKLEKARDTELLALTETTSHKLHELEQLARRWG